MRTLSDPFPAQFIPFFGKSINTEFSVSNRYIMNGDNGVCWTFTLKHWSLRFRMSFLCPAYLQYWCTKAFSHNTKSDEHGRVAAGKKKCCIVDYL
jgi:hypothetical protein